MYVEHEEHLGRNKPYEFGCRDNSNPIGELGCDKRSEPLLVWKFFCPLCTVLNYDGCQSRGCPSVVLAFLLGCCYTACCWTP
eukprot:g1311.t1